MKPFGRKASKTYLAMSLRGLSAKGPALATEKSVYSVSNMQKPSWCLVVKIMYFMPASSNTSAHCSGLKFTGLNTFDRPQYHCL